MNSIGHCIENVGVGACMGIINTCVALEKGILCVGEETSQIMYDVYSLDGLTRLSKVLISNMKLLSFHSRFQGVFDKCLKTINGQKDLYYAMAFITTSVPKFIKVTPDAITKRNIYSLQCPTKMVNGNEEYDWSFILCSVGNFFEAGKFLQKYHVFSFALCTTFANGIGSIPVFRYGRLDTIPVLQTVTTTPKDLCIFLASAWDIVTCLREPRSKLIELETLFKITASIGKMVLITFGPTCSKELWFAVVDVTTQDISLIGFIWKKFKERLILNNVMTRDDNLIVIIWHKFKSSLI